MTHPRLLLLIVVGVVSVAVEGARAEDTQKLRAEIAALRAAIDPLALPRLEQGDVVVGMSVGPLSRVVSDFAAASVDERSLRVGNIQQVGQLAGDDGDCKVGPAKVGEWGWFVELDPPTVKDVRLDLELSSSSATWRPGTGMDVTTGYRAYAGLITLHGHAKPCVGGGVGLRLGPIECTNRGALAGNGQVTYSQGTLKYEVSAWGTSLVECGVWAGSIIGDLRFALPVSMPRRQLFSGEMAGVFRQSGVLSTELSGAQLKRSYDVMVIGESLTHTATGVRVQLGAKVNWK